MLKVCKTSAKKSIEELCLITLRNEEFEEKLICCFKNDKNLVNFNIKKFDIKKYREVIFHDTYELCKI